MSDTATETPSATETDSPAIIADDSRIADETAFAAVLEDIRSEAPKAVQKYTSSANQNKRFAELWVMARSLIVKPDGEPDWNAGTDAYRLNVGTVVDEAFSKLGRQDRNRLLGSIRAHVNRTYLEQGIIMWVRANIAALSAKDDDGTYSVPESDERFKSAVRKQYDRCGLTVPPRYRVDGGAGTGGGPGQGAPSAATAVDNALSGLSQVTGDVASDAILRAVSALHVQLTAKDARFGDGGSAKVAENLLRIALVAQATAKMVSGKDLTERENENLPQALAS